MLAMHLNTSQQKLQLVELDTPVPSAHEVLLKVKTCGILVHNLRHGRYTGAGVITIP